VGTSFLVFGVVARTAGARMLERAIPLFLGLGIAAAVLFAPQGLDPRDVVAAASASPALRGALWAAWLLASVPLTGALLRDRRADFLRALPLSRALPPVATGAWLLVAQVPWAALFWFGGGAAAGLRALILGAGLAVLLAGRVRARFEVLLLGACLAAVALDAPAWVALALTPAIALAAERAWRRAPERPGTVAAWVSGPAPLALALAHHLRLVRVERFAVLRGVFIAAVGGAAAGLAARNTGRDDLAFLLAALAPALVLAASGIAAPLRDADAAIDTLLRSSGASPRMRRAATAAVAALWGGLFGGAGVAASRVGATALPWAVLLGGALAVVTVAVASRRGGVARYGALAVGTVTLTAFLGELAVLVLGALALASVVLERSRTRVPRSENRPAELLHVAGLFKRFGAREVLQDVSLSVAAGRVAVLRGPNGSGKSTLLRVLAGVLDKDDGAVFIAGRSLDAERRDALRAIGYAPDAGELPDHLSARELLALVAALKGAPAKEDEARFGIAHVIHERITALSLGQRRRVSLLAALVGHPPLLLLDEPTNGLDAGGLGLLESLLGEQKLRGGSALVATHESSFAARIADEVHALRRA
jgi:ABC-2 type transport system ATP-binding protein